LRTAFLIEFGWVWIVLRIAYAIYKRQLSHL
jgi:hypothetical protein